MEQTLSFNGLALKTKFTENILVDDMLFHASYLI
jgi:hypothetical protein